MLDEIDDIEPQREGQRPVGHRLKRLVALHLFPAKDAPDAPLHRRDEGSAPHQQHPLDLAAGNAAGFRHVDGVIEDIIEGDKKIVLLQKIQQVILGVAELVGLEMLGIKKAAAALALSGKLLLDLPGQGGKLRQDLLALFGGAAGPHQQILQQPPVDIIAAEEGAGFAQHPALGRFSGRRPGKGFRHADHRNIQGAAAKIHHAHHRTGPGRAVGNGGRHRFIHQAVRDIGVIFRKKGGDPLPVGIKGIDRGGKGDHGIGVQLQIAQQPGEIQPRDMVGGKLPAAVLVEGGEVQKTPLEAPKIAAAADIIQPAGGDLVAH